MDKKIKGILLDSGRVLNEPVSGHWMIPPNFFQYVDKERFQAISKTRRNEAFNNAYKYMAEQSVIRTEDEEYVHFLEHYRIISQELPELKLSDDQLDRITKDLVFNYDKYKFFDDVNEIIPILSKEYKLAVVSDAWPSLENVFVKAGLRKYFTSFIISSVVGVTKPNGVMYTTAIEELALAPQEVVFVDDNVRNCNGAMNVGITENYVLCRDITSFAFNKITCRKHQVVRTLNDIKRHWNK